MSFFSSLDPGSRVLVGGSRSLPGSAAALIFSVVAACLARGFGLAVGCCSGADFLALAAAAGSPGRVSLFFVGSASGRGFSGRSSAPFSFLSAFAARAGSVAWLAGGSLRVPLRARLVRRSAAAAAAASAGVFFLSSPGSRGSLLAAAALAARGCPVAVFCCGFSGSPAPLPGLAGSWLPGSLAGSPCFFWSAAAAQPSFF